MGIVHRDVKPENCLLSSNNQIKLTDFGFATIYRYKGKERLLDRVCGTYPYMAPELFKKLPHCGEPLDVWSAGITYIALITGQLCWQKATIECDLYRNYLTKIYKIKQPWVSIEEEIC
ncbi:MAG: Serine/threonine-protein kinase Chk1 [Marteilia pararefringens]